MKCIPNGLRLTCLLVMAVVALTCGCKRDKIAKRVLKTYEAPAWIGRGGFMIVKTETPESDVLLLRLRPFEEGVGKLFGFGDSNRLFADEEDWEEEGEEGEDVKGQAGRKAAPEEEVIYLYDPARDPIELEAFDLQTWHDATGPEWWDLQQERRVTNKLKYDWALGKLTHKRTVVPTVGDLVCSMAKSMHPGSHSVLILSARERNLGFSTDMDSNAPRLEKFYHQVYDLKTMEMVGKPVPLPFESEATIPRGVWAGADTYAIYTDGNHSPIHIVHMKWMPKS